MARKVEATLVEDIEAAAHIPGAIELRAGDAGLAFICPCGCGREGYLPFQPPGEHWSWDGDVEKPTLHPSIQHTDNHYHGWLKRGVWEG